MASQSSKPLINTGETLGEKATRKFKENPIVPVGALATTAALVVAMVKMRRGESRSFNNWLRVRVIAQGLTIIAVVAGTYSIGFRSESSLADPSNGGSRAEADLQKRREEKLGRERAEFEGRLRMAEETHRAEAGMAQKGASGVEKTVGTVASGPASAGGGGWLGWFGWSGRGGGKDSNTSANSEKKP